MLQELTTEFEHTAQSIVDGIHTALPGEIVEFDGAVATVKPIGKFITSDEVELDYPLITEAPVCLPFCQSVNTGMAFPVKKGDSCLIIVSEVELDAWRSGAESEGSLRFDLTSAVVIPGLLKTVCSAAVKASEQDAVVVVADDTEICITKKECKVTRGPTILKVSDAGVDITGNLNVTGDVKAGSVSLKNHTHTDSRGGGTTKPN